MHNMNNFVLKLFVFCVLQAYDLAFAINFLVSIINHDLKDSKYVSVPSWVFTHFFYQIHVIHQVIHFSI